MIKSNAITIPAVIPRTQHSVGVRQQLNENKYSICLNIFNMNLQNPYSYEKIITAIQAFGEGNGTKGGFPNLIQ